MHDRHLNHDARGRCTLPPLPPWTHARRRSQTATAGESVLLTTLIIPLTLSFIISHIPRLPASPLPESYTRTPPRRSARTRSRCHRLRSRPAPVSKALRTGAAPRRLPRRRAQSVRPSISSSDRPRARCSARRARTRSHRFSLMQRDIARRRTRGSITPSPQRRA